RFGYRRGEVGGAEARNSCTVQTRLAWLRPIIPGKKQGRQGFSRPANLAVSHTRIEPFHIPERSRLPSGEKAREATKPPSPAKAAISLPLFTSQSRMRGVSGTSPMCRGN